MKDEQFNKSHSFSRRDFLKTAGIILGTAGLLKYGRSGSENASALEINNNEIVQNPIETEIATYHPILEFHTQKPPYTTELAAKGVFPTVLFMEMLLNESSHSFQKNRDSESILYAQQTLPNGELAPFVDAQTIVDQANYRHEIAYEGIRYPSLNSDGALSSIQDFITNIAVLIDQKDGIVGNDAKELWKLQQELSQMDPNDVLVKVRSMFIARKIQTVAKYYYDLYERKNDVAFAVGKAHADVLKYLESGETTTLALINKLPNEILESLIKDNEGVDAFCTTVDIPVSDVIKDGKNAKNLIIDQDLKNMLETKLAKSEYAQK